VTVEQVTLYLLSLAGERSKVRGAESPLSSPLLVWESALPLAQADAWEEEGSVTPLAWCEGSPSTSPSVPRIWRGWASLLASPRIVAGGPAVAYTKREKHHTMLDPSLLVHSQLP
jgi:hypothetical protein